MAKRSLSARRAWIEIGTYSSDGSSPQVALRKESVDRNPPSKRCAEIAKVALRKESVDRNYAQLEQMLDDKVALRKESVDRNALSGRYDCHGARRSPQGERG